MHPFWAAVRHGLAVVAAFTLLYAALFSPVLFAGNLLAPGDGCVAFLTAFRSSRLAWDPYMFAGFPGLADPQRMAWYPPSLAIGWLPNAWNVYVVSAYVLASSFTYGYVYTLTRSRLAAAVAGTVFGMSGFMMAHLSHTNMVHSAAWLPAMVWCFEKLRRRADSKWVAVAAIAIAHCALAGHPQILVYAAGLVGTYALSAGIGAPAGKWRYYRAAVAAATLGLALAAILLLPLQQLAKRSDRDQMSYAVFNSFNLPARQLPQMIFPYAYGGPSNAPFFGEWNITETTGFVGILPLLLAGLGVAWATDRRLARYWLAVAVVALLLALGSDGGLSVLTYRLPILNKFRCPARHFGELALAVAVLAGWGVAALVAVPRGRRLRTCGVASLALTATVGVAWLCWAHFAHPDTASPPWRLGLRSLGIGLPLVALAIGLMALWAYAVRPSKLWAGALAVAVALDMGICARWADWSWGVVNEKSLVCPPVLARYRDQFLISGQRLTGLPSAPSTPVDAALANLPALWRLPVVGGYNPLILERTGQLLDAHLNGFYSHHLLHDDDRSLDILASRYVLAPKKLLEPGCPEYNPDVVRWLTGSGRFTRADELEQSVSFENTRAMPRAWLVDEVRQLNQFDVFLAVHESRLPDGSPYDPTRLALVEKPCLLAPSPADPFARAVPRELATGLVEVESVSRATSFCVLSDMFYPGWRATIDGRPTEVFRTNFVLMGVIVPPGKHTLRFEFVPTRFYLGAAISAAALLIVLGLLVRAWHSACYYPPPGSGTSAALLAPFLPTREPR